jgi:hypothetical protein
LGIAIIKEGDTAAMTVLHIVNGDSLRNKLINLTLGEDILVWREALYEGPIFSDLKTEEACQARAAYFATTIGLSEPDFRKQNEEQYKILTQHGAYDEIILWFEFDLFDQIMLIYLLDWFSKNKAPQTKLQLLSIGEFPGIELFTGLGQLTTMQLATLAGQWHEVTSEQLHIASLAWQAYASADPTAIENFLNEDISAAFPFLEDALLCHLGRFPSVSNGLGRLEQRALQCISEGLIQLIPLFERISKLENNYGLGDMQFWRYLERLGSGDNPLIRWTGPASLPRMDDSSSKRLKQWKLEITNTGKAVLVNKADWIELNGINRWLGGAHLKEESPMWRWDEETKKLIGAASTL